MLTGHIPGLALVYFPWRMGESIPDTGPPPVRLRRPIKRVNGPGGRARAPLTRLLSKDRIIREIPPQDFEDSLLGVGIGLTDRGCRGTFR